MQSVEPSHRDSRKVLVVGGATGIGRATAIRVADDGHQVAVLDIVDPDESDLVDAVRSRGRDLEYLRCDISKEDQVAAAVDAVADRLGGIDVLLHVAGIQRARGVEIVDLEVSDWDSLMNVNLRGAFFVVKHVTRHMEERGGVIVLTSSGAGVFGGSGSFPYGASKGGIHGLAMTLEKHLAPKGIRVNEVAPGWIDTPLLRNEVGDEAANTAKGPEGVAAVMAFLASSDADYVKGIVRTQ